MKKLLTILLFVSLKGFANNPNQIFTGMPYHWLKPPLPMIDYRNLPLWRGIGYGIISDSTATFTISKVRFTNASSTVNTSADGGGAALYILNSSNITIDSCTFDSTYNTAAVLRNCSNITIKNCLFANVNRGVYPILCTGSIVIQNNQFLNVRGYATSPSEGHRGQLVQLNTCTGTGNLIAGNRAENFFAESYNQDLISVYASQGTSGDPITVEDNILRGGGPSNSGGGIIFGDQSGQWGLIQRNFLSNPGQYGIQAGGGQNATFLDNTIFSQQWAWSNCGFLVWNFGGGTCDNHTMDNTNTSKWQNSSNANNDMVTGSCPGSACCGTVTGGGAVRDNAITASTNMPDPFFTMIDSFAVYKYRADTTFNFLIVAKGLLRTFGPPPDTTDLTRPTCSAGSDQSITSTTATLTGTAAATASNVPDHPEFNNTIYSVRWVQVSGPTTATMSAATSLTNNLSNLSTGTYEFMLEATQNTDQYDYKSFMFDFMEIEVTLSSNEIKVPFKIVDINNYKHNWASR